jgi:hypothetical protein
MKLDLKYDPITMMVPPSWELKPLNDAGGMVILEGDTPTDTVSISIPTANRIINAPNVPAEVQVKQLEAAAKADAAKYPDLIKGDVVRDIPGGRVIEDLSVVGPLPTTQSATDDATRTMQWIFTVCVPADNGFTTYELRFHGLTLKNYKADQAFLRSIMNSITLTAPTTDALPK